jgi:hypothetical protein
MFEDADLIHRYTRADAIRDGVLIDVSAVASEAGIRYSLTHRPAQAASACRPGARCAPRTVRVVEKTEASNREALGVAQRTARRMRLVKRPGGGAAGRGIAAIRRPQSARILHSPNGEDGVRARVK